MVEAWILCASCGKKVFVDWDEPEVDTLCEACLDEINEIPPAFCPHVDPEENDDENSYENS